MKYLDLSFSFSSLVWGMYYFQHQRYSIYLTDYNIALWESLYRGRLSHEQEQSIITYIHLIFRPIWTFYNIKDTLFYKIENKF